MKIECTFVCERMCEYGKRRVKDYYLWEREVLIYCVEKRGVYCKEKREILLVF